MRPMLPLLAVTAAVVAGSIALFGRPAADADVTLYKNPQCTCCEGYADYLRQNGIVGIAEIDTRRLTRILREKGAQSGCIVAGAAAQDGAAAVAAARAFSHSACEAWPEITAICGT